MAGRISSTNQYDLRARLLGMKSVMARYGLADDRMEVPAALAAWNNAAVLCDEIFYYMRRDGTLDGSMIRQDLSSQLRW